MSVRRILEEHGGFIFRFVTFADIKESLRDAYGKESNSILYNAAIKAGRRSCRRRLAAARSREEGLRLLVAYKANQNWGDIVFEEVDWEKRSGSKHASKNKHDK